MTFQVLLAVLIALQGIAHAQGYVAEDNWKAICEKATAQPLTKPQLSGPLRNDALSSCDESALYYGFYGRPDYSAALQCGWYQYNHPQDREANMFYGPGVLTMLYANGQGVSRNYELAIRFSCENQWASDGEHGLRLGHIDYLRERSPAGGKLDLCDDITSGLNMGACTKIVARKREAERSKKIAAIQRNFGPQQRRQFALLQEAEEKFEDARIANEVDLSGTARAALQWAEQDKLQNQFFANLKLFSRAELPQDTQADVRDLDRELTDVLNKIQGAPAKTWQWGTIKPEGIRETERAWLKLVNAWIDFVAAADSKLSAEQVRSQLVRVRLHQLRGLLPRH